VCGQRLRRRLRGMTQGKLTLKACLLTGVLIWLPFAVTLWVLDMVISTMDSMINWLPMALQPTHWFGMHIPGSGLVLALLIVLLTGFLAANMLGQKVVGLWEAMLGRIPVVKTIYNSVKQVSDTLLSGSGQAFSKALLVQFPHQDAWTIAFLTGKPGPGVAEHLNGDYVSVYVPTTPNPTSGYLMLVARSAVRELDMSVDDALKYIISMGVVAPAAKPVPPSTPTSR
jgi:uncharacterized membrane protein